MTMSSHWLLEHAHKADNNRAVMPKGAIMIEECTAHIYQCDLDRLLTSECVVEAYSVEMRHVDKGCTVPLYSSDEMHKLQAETERLQAILTEVDHYFCVHSLVSIHEHPVWRKCVPSKGWGPLPKALEIAESILESLEPKS
jgi:hypothetical protein